MHFIFLCAKSVHSDGALTGVTVINFVNGVAAVTPPKDDYRLFIWDDMKPVAAVITP